jgi:hypothetical protein
MLGGARDGNRMQHALRTLEACEKLSKVCIAEEKLLRSDQDKLLMTGNQNSTVAIPTRQGLKDPRIESQ